MIPSTLPGSLAEELHQPLSEGNAMTTGVMVINTLARIAVHKVLIAKVTVAAMLLGLLFSFLIPTQFTSVTKIMPPRQTQSTTALLNSMPGGGSLGDMASGGLGLKDPNAIYIGLLKSRPIADALITRFGLQAVYGAKTMTLARTRLESATQIDSERSGLISISVSDRDKTRAAAVANAYTVELRILTKNISVTEATKRRLFFEEQLREANDDLASAEVSLQQFQQDKGLVHLDSQASVIVGGLAGIHGGIETKEVELQTLRSYSTEQNPDVQLLEREISALQDEAARLEHNGGSAKFSNMGLQDVPKAGLEYVRSQRELQYRQAFYDLILRQYEAAKLDEGKEAAVIQVVEPGIPPEYRSSPHRTRIVATFAFLGFLTACACLYLGDLARRSPEMVDSLRDLRSSLSRR